MQEKNPLGTNQNSISKLWYQTEYKKHFGKQNENVRKENAAEKEEKEYVLSHYVNDSKSEMSKSSKNGKKHHRKCNHKKRQASSVKKTIRFSPEEGIEKMKEPSKTNIYNNHSNIAVNNTKPVHRNLSNNLKSYVIGPNVAGKMSSLYERQPFIQGKRRSRVPNSDHFIYSGTADLTQNVFNRESSLIKTSEPAIQRKKIVPYDKNHNILRTNILDYKPASIEKMSPVMRAYFSEDIYEVDKSYIDKVLSKFHKFKDHPSKDIYKTSYSIDYSVSSLQANKPPVVKATHDVTKTVKTDNKENKHDKSVGNKSSFVYTKSYSPRNYETEYDSKFKNMERKKKEDYIFADHDKENFSTYYENVLKNRPIAYLSKDNLDQDESPFKKIEVPHEKSKTQQTRTSSPAQNSFTVENNDTIESQLRHNSSTDIHSVDNNKTSTVTPVKKVSKKTPRKRNKAPSTISGSSVSKCSICSCHSYPSSYDPSVYSDSSSRI